MGVPITPAELDEWRRVYPTGGSLAVQALFPHRSRGTIKITCHRHGIKMADRHTALRIKAKCNWPEAHDHLILTHYETIGATGLMAMIPDRTYSAIVARAAQLGCRRSRAVLLDGPKKSRREVLRGLFAAGQRVSA